MAQTHIFKHHPNIKQTHIFNHCPKNKENITKERNDEKVICQYCDKIGHTAKEMLICKSKIETQEERLS